MTSLATIRARLMGALTVGLCTGCWAPEYKAEELNAAGAAPATVQTGLPADGCIERWQFPDDFELKVDFETMVTPTDGFRLGELAGYVRSGGGTDGLFIRAGHDDSSTRSLLLMLSERGSGQVGLHWRGCLDVSTRRGIRFWAKGVGTSSVQPRLSKAPADGECVPRVALDLTEGWRMYEETWDKFCPSGTESAFAQRLTGMQLSLQHTLSVSEPWIAIDDVSFID